MSLYHPANEHPYSEENPVIGANRESRILAHLLKAGSDSASNLAMIFDCPQPSIRRSIAKLRADGANITFSGYGANELYRLGE